MAISGQMITTVDDQATAANLCHAAGECRSEGAGANN
jgi:hypothetical protein